MQLLTPKQAAEFLRISSRTLETMRRKGTGPYYTKLGGLVRYPMSELEEWVQLNKRRATRHTPAVVCPDDRQR